MTGQGNLFSDRRSRTINHYERPANPELDAALDKALPSTVNSGEEPFDRYIPKYDDPLSTPRGRAEAVETSPANTPRQKAQREDRIQARMSGVSEDEIAHMHDRVPKSVRQYDPTKEALKKARQFHSLARKARGRRR